VEEENRAMNISSSTRNFYQDNHYVGELKHPNEGFYKHKGPFDKNLWYDPSDANWKTLVEFVKDKSVPVKGTEINVLDIIGYNVERR
jgi:hypothetical protein